MFLKRSIFIIAISMVISLLTGCGGGGGSGGSDDDNDPSSNQAPVANAGTNQTIDEQTQCVLDGTGSSDDNGIVQYAWAQVGTPQVTLQNSDSSTATFTAPATTTQLTLTFQLTVTDSDGLSDNDQVQITVNGLTSSPTASAGSDQSAIEGELVTLDGSASSDGDGTITSYSWVQTGGTTVALAGDDTVQPTFTAPGTTELLTFQLTVEDDEGFTATDDVTVYVAELLLSDDFSDANHLNWTTIDESGAGVASSELDPAYWPNGVTSLQQANYLANQSSYDASYHLGAYAISDLGSGWDDYRFSVDISPVSDGVSGDPEGNDVGIMFRYADSDNYYRFSMSARYGFSRLEKKQGGTFTTLKVDARGYEDGQTYTVAVEVQGDTILIFLEGDPLFAYTDTGTSLSSGTVGVYCQDEAVFDNVLVTASGLEPDIVITSPVAYSIATTGGNNALNAVAAVINAPSGASVAFTLDSATTLIDETAPFSVQFTGVSQGDHDIDAVLRDGTDQAVATDTNFMIGVDGDYFITVGNSITNGRGDEDSSNNTSADERIISSQGYQAVLNGLLTNEMGYPQIIFNEGIGGDTAENASVDRIDSILERHPGANIALVLLGTNDARLSVAPATYQSNMQALVTSLSNAGLQVWVAKIPPDFSGDGFNSNIEALNSRIDNLTGISDGPDFYDSLYDASLYDADGIHPNNSGYGTMAQGWLDSLKP
jgi:lysophospholipase L1-like esterase